MADAWGGLTVEGASTRAGPHAQLQPDPHRPPSDLRSGKTPSHVAEAIRNGTARLVGFESLRDVLALLEAQELTRFAYVPEARIEPSRRWVSLADMPGHAVFPDEVDAYPCRGSRGHRDGRGVGSRVLPEAGLIAGFRVRGQAAHSRNFWVRGDAPAPVGLNRQGVSRCAPTIA